MPKHIKRLRIRNILGIEELEIEPGAVTVISGGNGVGKTSFLQAILGAVGGGHDATLLRKGAEEGEVVLVLDDDIEVTKRITAGRSELVARHPLMGKVSAPQSMLNGLTDALSVNPVAFLTAKPQDRAKALLDALPAEVTREELEDAVRAVVPLPPGFERGHALEVIDRAHKAIYEERTAVNREAKRLRTTSEQLRAGLPREAPEEGQRERLQELQADLRVMRQAYENDTHATHTRAHEEGERLRADFDGQIEALRQQIAALEKERNDRLAAIRARTTEALERRREKFAEAEKKFEAEIATLEERQKHAVAHANTRQQADAMAKDATRLEEDSEALTSALGRLDLLRDRTVAKLPIEGLGVRNGDLLFDDIAFDRLNHAKQIQAAVRVARLRAGELGVVCVDGLEALEPPLFEGLLAKLEEEGLQAFVTRVTEGPLAIETRGA